MMHNIDVRKVTVLPRESWDRITSRLDSKTVNEQQTECRIAERKRLHEKSKSVVKNWSNTIEGQRQRKLAARAERLENEELEQQKIDKEEAKFQQAKRKEAIDQAKTLQYYETDRVKNFHKAMLLSEVLKERDAQVVQKKQIKLVQSKREALFTEANNKNYALQASGEEQMKLKSKNETLEVAAYQKQQRKAKNEEIKHEIIADIHQGQAYRKADEEYMVWLLEKHAKEREEKRDVNKQIINQIAQKKRLQELDIIQSKAEDEEIKLFDKAKSVLKTFRKNRERQIFEDRQQVSLRIKDNIEANTKAAKDMEDSNIAKAVAEKELAEDRMNAAKNNARRQARVDIKVHRMAELNRLHGESEFEKKKNEEDLKTRVKIDNDYLESEKTKWASKKNKSKEYQIFYKDQINQRATKERIAIDNELNCDAKEKEARHLEELEFQKYAEDVISRANQMNKNTFPLIKAAMPGDGGGHGPVDAVGSRPSFQSTDAYGVQLPTYQKGSTEAVKKYYTPNDMAHAKKRFGFVW
jgi:hypothetical protein